MPGRSEPAATEWQRVAEDILAGICHSLNSRVTTLWGVAELLALHAPGAGVPELLRDEVRRVERSVRLLQWLCRRTGSGGEIVSLGDLLPDFVELHREHRGLEGARVTLEGDARTPPVAIDPVALCRAVLLLLSAAARAVSGPDAAVRVSYGPAGAGAGLTIRAHGPAAAAVHEPSAELAAARRLLADSAVDVSVSRGSGASGAAVAVELRFPAL